MAAAVLGLFTICAAVSLLLRKDWARVSLAAISWLAVAVVGGVGLLLQLDPERGLQALIIVAILALGPVGLVGLIALYVTLFLLGPLGGQAPPMLENADLAAAGRFVLLLALVPAVSAIILHRRTFRDAMRRWEDW